MRSTLGIEARCRMPRRPQQAQPAAPGNQPSFHRFTVGEYRWMVEQGILGENDRVELLDGLIVDKTTHNPPHDACISLVKDEIEPRLSRPWMLRFQSAVRLSTSEPEPDLAVRQGTGPPLQPVAPASGRYRDAHRSCRVILAGRSRLEGRYVRTGPHPDLLACEPDRSAS